MNLESPRASARFVGGSLFWANELDVAERVRPAGLVEGAPRDGCNSLKVCALEGGQRDSDRRRRGRHGYVVVNALVRRGVAVGPCLDLQ